MVVALCVLHNILVTIKEVDPDEGDEGDEAEGNNDPSKAIHEQGFTMKPKERVQREMRLRQLCGMTIVLEDKFLIDYNIKKAL